MPGNTQQVSVSNNPPLIGVTNDRNEDGVTGQNNDIVQGVGSGVLGVGNFLGVHGMCRPATQARPAARTGVLGMSDAGIGVYGSSKAGFGFLGGNDPVFSQHAGVYGQSDQQGVMGLTSSDGGSGVYGGGAANPGGAGAGCIGVRGETFSGVGVQGQSFGGGLAAKFIGNVEVSGTITVKSSGNGAPGDIVLADFSEDFDISDIVGVEPGTVMVLNARGALEQSHAPYDKKVAGVVSGGGSYRPAIVLDKQASQKNRLPIALMGKVFCKVDARESSIEAGDLLTTSPTPGHAMKACDPLKAFGSVIGKALRPLKTGTGMIPVLISLQ